MVVHATAREETLPLSRAQLTGHIMELNPTATPTFLAGFTNSQLVHYLRHLLSSQEPRGATARWVRPNDSPAIQRWEAAA